MQISLFGDINTKGQFTGNHFRNALHLDEQRLSEQTCAFAAKEYATFGNVRKRDKSIKKILLYVVCLSGIELKLINIHRAVLLGNTNKEKCKCPIHRFG